MNRILALVFCAIFFAHSSVAAIVTNSGFSIMGDPFIVGMFPNGFYDPNGTNFTTSSYLETGTVQPGQQGQVLTLQAVYNLDPNINYTVQFAVGEPLDTRIRVQTYYNATYDGMYSNGNIAHLGIFGADGYGSGPTYGNVTIRQFDPVQEDPTGGSYSISLIQYDNGDVNNPVNISINVRAAKQFPVEHYSVTETPEASTPVLAILAVGTLLLRRRRHVRKA